MAKLSGWAKLALCSLPLLLVSSEIGAVPPMAGVGGDASISAPFKGALITLRTTNRLAGGIGSLTWNGVELLDNPPQYLRGIGANVVLDKEGFCYNPNDGGSRSDYFKPTSTSRLLALQARGNVLDTSKQLAFFLAPGQSDPRCGTARNETALSNYIVRRRVTIGVYGVANAIDFQTTFIVPERRQNGYFVPLGVHAAGMFARFDSYNPETRALTDMAVAFRSQQHSRLPVVASTSDQKLALGIYSPLIQGAVNSANEKAAYTVGNFTEAGSPTTKLNCAFFRQPVSPAAYEFPCYLLVGTLADVTTGMSALSHNIQQGQR